jgi:alpha-galactosidase
LSPAPHGKRNVFIKVTDSTGKSTTNAYSQRNGVVQGVPLLAGQNTLSISAAVSELAVSLPNSAATNYPATSTLSFDVASSMAGSKEVWVEYINYDLSFDKSWSGEGLNVLNATFSVNGGAGKTWRFPISGGSWKESGKMRIQLEGFQEGMNTIKVVDVEGKLEVVGLEVW